VTYSRHLGGIKAQARGNEFEFLVRNRCRSLGLKYTHHPTGCKPFGRGKFHTIKTGYDFTLFYDQRVVLIDAKATKDKTFQKSLAKPHQVEALLDLEYAGYTAGYLIYFRPHRIVCFAKASQLHYLEPRSSLSIHELVSIGDIDNFDLRKLFEISTAKSEIERLVSNE